ncbi:3H domain-containing protein [Streptococcus ictaluri]|uniref:3H domain protein n=1 Tax=Streptococcus ictaluri 707-05 TaxID=764299 RepID=G5K5V5_9STRE|nr:transcription repressor NadR [Streptococcus ictaluri]EHI68778.1 3H domain protein [Streptococcus ictaluri 707-05]
MIANDRRQAILIKLQQVQEALSASSLAKELGVSRQVIVGDIALLRAQQIDIISTPKGYLLSSALFTNHYSARLVCQHGPEQTEEELQIILAHDGIISTVEVEHPIYGMLTAPLNIKSQSDMLHFITKLKDSKAELLSSLTEGVHAHLISCPSQEAFEDICQDLKAAKILYQEK